MQYAMLLSLCVVAASPTAPPATIAAAATIEAETAARAFRIESYNRCREDRERYRQLRDADDDLRLGLSAATDRDFATRQEEAIRWYREATAAVHAGRELPASPVWLPEALADAAAGKFRDPSSTPIAAKKNSEKPATTHVLPPQLAPQKSVEQAANATEKPAETPFFFVNAALRAMGGYQPAGSMIDDVKEPVIDPVGPVVDGRVQEPETAPAKGSRVRPAASQDESSIEPTLELPTLELPTLESDADSSAPIEMPAMELPELSSN